jgi:hypothetical protein
MTKLTPSLQEAVERIVARLNMVHAAGMAIPEKPYEPDPAKQCMYLTDDDVRQAITAELSAIPPAETAMEDDKPLFEPDGNDYHVNAFTFMGLDAITAINVGRLAKALAMKLYAAKEKYGYTDGWAQPGWEDECRAALLHHIEKGDPLDVAAFAMFMWKHGWSTAGERHQPAQGAAQQREALAKGHAHLTISGKFQSDKYPWCPAGFLPLKLTDAKARDLLIIYANRRGLEDGEFGGDLLAALGVAFTNEASDYEVRRLSDSAAQGQAVAVCRRCKTVRAAYETAIYHLSCATAVISKQLEEHLK